MTDDLKKSLKAMIIKALLGNLAGGILGCLIGTIIVSLFISIFLTFLHQIYFQALISILDKMDNLMKGNVFGTSQNSGVILYLCVILPISCKIAIERTNKDDEFSIRKLQRSLFLKSLLLGGILSPTLLGILFILGEIVKIEVAFILLIMIGAILYLRFREGLKGIELRKLMILGVSLQLIGLWQTFLFSIPTMLLGSGLLFLGEIVLLWNLIRDIIIFKKQIKQGLIKEEKDFQMYKNINYDFSLITAKLIYLVPIIITNMQMLDIY